jgi:hypothetical protein
MGSRDGRSGKAPHKEESVGIFDGIKRTQYFHSDFSVRRNAFGVKYLQEAGSGRFVRPHFDNHFDNLCVSGGCSPITFGTGRPAPFG